MVYYEFYLWFLKVFLGESLLFTSTELPLFAEGDLLLANLDWDAAD